MHEIADLTISLLKVPELKEHTQLDCQAVFHRDEKSTKPLHITKPNFRAQRTPARRSKFSQTELTLE